LNGLLKVREQALKLGHLSPASRTMRGNGSGIGEKMDANAIGFAAALPIFVLLVIAGVACFRANWPDLNSALAGFEASRNCIKYATLVR
jgi:hypothetical protein